MNVDALASRRALRRFLDQPYRWPDRSCFALAQAMAEEMGVELDLSEWYACEDEAAALRLAVRRHRRPATAFRAILGAVGPWHPERCDACVQQRVGPGDLLLLGPGLMMASGYVTDANTVALIGPSHRAWAWSPRRLSYLCCDWGVPLAWMALED